METKKKQTTENFIKEIQEESSARNRKLLL